MIVFGIIAAGLLVLALGLVLPALLRKAAPTSGATGKGAPPSASRSNLAILRDQLTQLDAELAAGTLNAEQHRQSRGEIERRVLDEEAVAEAPRQAGSARRTAAVVGTVIPLMVLGLYAAKGNVAALDPQARQARAEPAAAEPSAAQIEEMVDKLARKLESQATPQPGDAQGWAMLARSYGFMQRFPEASRAYSRAIALDPKNPDLLADHADVLAALQDQRLAGEPMRLIEQALQLNPNHPKALALAGSGAFERKDFAAAVNYWAHARRLLPADGEFAKALDGSIAEARKAGGMPLADASVRAPAPASAPAASGAPAQVAGRVSLAPALAARAAPTDTVFIFARAAEGPRMPLAILKRTVADLPITFKLDDSMAMSAQMKLSNFPAVVVGARIAKSGNAMPQPGDLQGQAGPVQLGSTGIELVIDSVQP